MIGFSERAQNTVVAIVSALEREDIPYAVARNYENYPNFGHDFDLFYDGTNEAFRTIAARVGKEIGWDVVTHCGHWNRSRYPLHNIEVFHFMSLEPLERMQIDLFRGFLIWAMPLASSEQIIRGAKRHPSGEFQRPDEQIETVFRLLQINSLISDPNQRRKIEKYRTRVLADVGATDQPIIATAKSFGFALSPRSIEYLKCMNDTGFRRSMNLAKLRFVLASFFKDPTGAVFKLISRVREYYLLFHADPCGLIVKIAAETAEQRNMAKRALDRLKGGQFLSDWRVREGNLYLSFSDRRVLERGGILVEWVNSHSHQSLARRAYESEQSMFLTLRDRIVFRPAHDVIYRARR